MYARKNIALTWFTQYLEPIVNKSTRLPLIEYLIAAHKPRKFPKFSSLKPCDRLDEWSCRRFVVPVALVGPYLKIGRQSGRCSTNIVIKDHMIFDLIDLFNRNGFRLIKSNHSLTTDYRFLWKTCIISWILDEICTKFHPLLAILVIWARNHLLFELEINSKMRPSV